jgi:hypothetical protein
MATYTGTSSSESWTVISPGTFTLDGMGGVDTLSLGTSLRSSYTITMATDGAVHVDSVSGASGTLHAMLYNMEILKFNSNRDSLDLRIYFGPISLTGTSADDTLKPGSGLYAIDASAGTDTVVISGASSSYKLTLSASSATLASSDGISSYVLQNVESLQFTDKTIPIASQTHSAYTSLPDALWHFFIVAFNAVPGVTYMNQLAEAYSYFSTTEKTSADAIQKIVDVFTSKSQFTDVYPSTLTHSEMATQLVSNIVKDSASAAVKQTAVDDIAAALDLPGWSLGKVIYTVFGNLATKSLTDADWGSTAKQFQNEITVAKYYTDTLAQSTTDLTSLRALLTPVTASTDTSTDALVATLIGVNLLQQ